MAAKITDPHLLAELLRRHREQVPLRALASWLKEERGIEASHEAVRSALRRAEVARGQMLHDPLPTAQAESPLLDPELGPVTPEEQLAAIRAEIAEEVREARADRDTSWKRYHSARALQLRALALTLPKAQPDTSPESQPGAAPPAVVTPPLFGLRTEPGNA